MKRYTRLLSELFFDFSTHQQSLVWLVTALFFILLLPVLPQVSTYHSDERFYTDAAVYMIQQQDLVTPHYPDGSLRLNKPIVTYWVLIASYAVLGINYFAARLPFLVAGCFTLWLTWKLSFKLFGRRRDALLAVAILASNVQFITLCLRATPDILQVLFLNLSLYGFYALIFDENRRLPSYLMAYLGAALAVETKGFLGVAPVAYAFIFTMMMWRKPRELKKLVRWPVVFAAAALAVSWFLLMYWQHGHQALGRFYQDQVGERLSGPKYFFLLNLKDYLWGVVRYFMPWLMLIMAGYWPCRTKVQAFLRQNIKAVAFIVGWTALLMITFAGGNISRTRYLIPAYPLLAVLTASIFIQMIDHSGMQRFWRWICGAILSVLIITGSLLALGGVLLHWRLACAGVLFLAMAGPGLWFIVKRKKNLAPLAMSLHILLATACIHILVLPVFDPVPARQVVTCVLQQNWSGQSVSLWAERKFKFAGQLFLLSKGRIKGFHFDKGELDGDLNGRALVLLSRKSIDNLPLENYEIQECGSVSRPVKTGGLWEAFRTGGREAFFQAMQEPCYLVRRKP